jgi:hypothetical protein
MLPDEDGHYCREAMRLDRESARHAARHLDKLKRDLQDSGESAKSTASSRSRLSKGCCFNAGIMSRALQQAVGGILHAPLKHVPLTILLPSARHLDKLKHVPLTSRGFQ